MSILIKKIILKAFNVIDIGNIFLACLALNTNEFLLMRDNFNCKFYYNCNYFSLMIDKVDHEKIYIFIATYKTTYIN